MLSNFRRTAGLAAIFKITLSCCLLVCLFPLKASAQYEFKLKVNHYELLQHLLGNVGEIRVAFLDLSDSDSIFPKYECR
jgi:glycopeptide antibiotics resistance protein